MVDREAPARSRALLTALALALLVTGCAGTVEPVVPLAAGGSSAPPVTASGQATPAEPSYAVPAPGPLEKPLLTADVLITGSRTLPDRLITDIAAVPGVAAAIPLSVASAPVDERTLTVAAVDPAAFRRFTPVGSAQADAVWERVAGGEVALDPAVGKKLEEPGGMVRLGNQESCLSPRFLTHGKKFI